MIFFKDIDNLQDLKMRYRKLAWKFHPDRGGHLGLMQKLNQEYHTMRSALESQLHEIKGIKTGDIVYVNGSESLVIESRGDTFIAKSKITRRQALFDRYTGQCITYKKFKASTKNQTYAG